MSPLAHLLVGVCHVPWLLPVDVVSYLLSVEEGWTVTFASQSTKIYFPPSIFISSPPLNCFPLPPSTFPPFQKPRAEKLSEREKKSGNHAYQCSSSPITSGLTTPPAVALYVSRSRLRPAAMAVVRDGLTALSRRTRAPTPAMAARAAVRMGWRSVALMFF